MNDLERLTDERAHALNEIDDILDTARDQGSATLARSEQQRHDELTARVAYLDREIRRAQSGDPNYTAAGVRVDVQRSAYAPAPNGVMTTAGTLLPSTSRSLDELLWATDEYVDGITISDKGQVSRTGARNPVEQVAIRSQGGGSGVLAPRITDYAPESRQAVRAFQQTVADMILFGLLVDKQAQSSVHGFEVARSHRAFADRWRYVMRALDVDTSGEGGAWVPTGIGAAVHEKVRAAGKIAPLFTRINLPTNPWKWPIEGADATAYRVAEPTGDTTTKMTASTPGTGAATFDAEIFGARTLVSRSLDADSAVAITPFVSAKLVRAFVDAEEKAILDGDTDGTHQDSDIGASTTDARTAWDGLRKKALAQTTQATTTMSVANMALIRQAMGKWGVDPSGLAFIVGVSSFYKLITDTNLLTLDKYGPNATILNGELGRLYGIPVIVSEHVREDLNASGVYDGITTTKTYGLCVNRGEWVMGQRMALDVEVDDSIYRETYQRVLVGFMREDFQSIADAAANDDTSIGYNLTP